MERNKRPIQLNPMHMVVGQDEENEGNSEGSALLPDGQAKEGHGTVEYSAPSHFDGPIPLKIALRAIILEKTVSVFLLLIPFAYMAHAFDWGARWVFWLNFCVMIPLASILGDFTEEAALHTSETLGGLLNATFGNMVEVVVGIQALLANEIRVVQGSMLGSIFSNLLLVLGCCFFFGGLKYKEQTFNATNASANIGLLALSSIALVLPTPYAAYYEIHDEGVLAISRYAAVFLLFMYIQLLVFQLYTHQHLTEGSESSHHENDEGGEDEEEEEEPSISLKVALIGLLVTTLTVTVFSDFLVESIDEFCKESNMSRTFVGLILLPIVGNAVEHITAVTVAMKDKMDLSMGVAADLETRIASLENGAQFEANQNAIRQREQEMLTTLREIRESMATTNANTASSTEVDSLKEENARLKGIITKQEYRIRHLISGYENLLEEKKVEEVVQEV
ncbi:MAG: hypothetical protein SGBAC_002796 [Bacillariaceae sp.]